MDRTINLLDYISLYCFFPILQATVNDANILSGYLRAKKLEESHRNWIEFAHALMRWKVRFDIMVEEKIEHIDVGEFDIEIEG